MILMIGLNLNKMIVGIGGVDMSNLDNRTAMQIVFDDGETELKEATAKYVDAERLYDATCSPIHKKRSALAEKFRALINKEFEGCGKRYTSGYMSKYGITLTIGADHPNDRVIDDFGWDEIQEKLPNDDELRLILSA